MNTQNRVHFNYSDFEEELNLKRCINYYIHAYLKFLSVFREVFREYLSKEWIEQYEQVEAEYESFRGTLREVFQSGQL